MSIEEGSNKAITDLGLSLNFHNHSIRLNNEIGAGVNATTSKVDITLVTSHPLSELVWCPRKGISVKKTDCDRSLTVKESPVLWGLRQSNMAVSSAKSISSKRNSKSDNFVDDKNDVSSPCLMKFVADEVDASGRVSRSRSMVMSGIIHGQDEVFKTAGCGPSLGVGNNDDFSAIPGNASIIAICNQEGPSRQCNASTAYVDQDGKSMLKIPGAITNTSNKLEFSAENYILAGASMDANPEAMQHKSICLVDGSFHADDNLTNHRKEAYLRKGKGKALSDGDINDEAEDDNVSHGSAGSCNSRKVASSRNTKRSVDQQLIVSSKRLRLSSQQDADSASFIRQSSSFMSWIQNMVKGYPGCNQNDTSSSTFAGMLTTGHTEQESRSQKPVGHDLRGTGFKNLFQSIYCSNNGVKERKIYLDYQSNEESCDVKPSSMVDLSAVPLAAYNSSDNVPGDSSQSHMMCDQPTSDNPIGSPSKQGIILSPNVLTKKIKILPGMNAIPCNVVNGMDTAISSQSISISSTDKKRAHVSEYDEEKEAQPIGQKKDYCGSLWITRFRPKVSQPESNFVTRKLIISKRVQGEGLMDEVQGEHSSGDPMISRSEGNNGFVKHQGLVGSEQVNVKDEQNLEVMASIFARRLDALKQVVPFDATCMPSSTGTTCLFCGIRGHDIQACSKITESELEELFHVIRSYDKFKDSSCMCIKCFQLSHWAIECPQRSSRKSALGSFVDWSNDIDLYSYRRNKEQMHFLDKNDQLIGGLAPMGTSGNLKPDTESIQLHDFSKLNRDIANIRNPLDSKSGGRDAGETSASPPSKISDSMEGIFNAVRRLRLSRSDFLRLVDSQISPSHLRGFYLRVRLSNWKEGLGGKGYYVACIHSTNSATNRGTLDQCQSGVKASVGITIGSFACMVDSRYISNQDFLEDELMTWWKEITAKCDHSQNPSLEELEQKYEERQRLGF